MSPQVNELLLVLLVTLFALTTGEKYSVDIYSQEVPDELGECNKLVKVNGNGLEDLIPVHCDMVKYMVANEQVLVVGDRIYSDKAETLMILAPHGCEKRLYSYGAVMSVQQLEQDECQEIKLAMMKAYLATIPDEKDSSSDSSDESDSDVSESKVKTYEELRKWISDNLESNKDSRLDDSSAEDDDAHHDTW